MQKEKMHKKTTHKNILESPPALHG